MSKTLKVRNVRLNINYEEEARDIYNDVVSTIDSWRKTQIKLCICGLLIYIIIFLGMQIFGIRDLTALILKDQIIFVNAIHAGVSGFATAILLSVCVEVHGCDKDTLKSYKALKSWLGKPDKYDIELFKKLASWKYLQDEYSFLEVCDILLNHKVTGASIVVEKSNKVNLYVSFVYGPTELIEVVELHYDNTIESGTYDVLITTDGALLIKDDYKMEVPNIIY